MIKHVAAVALAIAILAPEAAGQSIVQRPDWRGRSIDWYLPLSDVVPWLKIDHTTKRLRGDFNTEDALKRPLRTAELSLTPLSNGPRS
ncbi:MAG: hypothetical protein JO000_05700 [Alphaproteobacteria bacterium]|nr:hypothetical protein [Alphaproteobacteria bacterium]